MSYAIALFGTAIVVMTLVFGCHHRPPGSDAFTCSDFFAQYGRALICGLLIVGHSIAVTLAVVIAPTSKMIVGTVATLLPVGVLSFLMRNTVTGDVDLYGDVLPVVLIGIPTGVYAFVLVRMLERRRVA